MPRFETSPKLYCRLGGLAYLVIIALGIFGESYVRGSLVVSGDGVATASRIAAAQGLWRLGIAGDLLMHLLDVPLIVLFYFLLRPVNHALAVLSTVFNVVQTSVLAVNKLTLIAPLLLVTATGRQAELPSSVLGSLISLTTSLHGYGFGIGLLFFGLTCIVRGYLLRKSVYFPAYIGTLLFVAGVCYLLNSVALLVAPKIANLLFPWVLIPALVGELALALWLALRGVDNAAWASINTVGAAPAKSAI